MTESNLLKDESSMRWNFLESEADACVVFSEWMEIVYLNTAARRLVPDEWFGKRCFDVLPIADQTCALHCPKIKAVSDAPEVVYCEESLQSLGSDGTFGVGLIPLGPESPDRSRAVLVLRRKEPAGNQEEFSARLVKDAERVRDRIVGALS